MRARKLLLLLSLLAPSCEASLNVRYDHQIDPGRVISAQATIAKGGPSERKRSP